MTRRAVSNYLNLNVVWRWRQSSANPSLLCISLFSAKIQGTLVHKAGDGEPTARIGEQIQYVRSEFPNNRDREIAD